MSLFLRALLAAGTVGVVLDILWLGNFMAPTYRNLLGSLARRSGESLDIVWWAAGVVYVLLAFGVVYFAVTPGVERGMGEVALRGALFGLVVYGVYDFTNHATLQGWSLKLVAIDVVWGCCIGAAMAVAAAVSLRIFS